jgi:sugar O-acyltransferase (sialic acid O-acetyltransferase NeuD family)
MAKVVIFGVSQWAELAHFYLTHDSPHEVVAFTLDRAYLQSTTFKGLPVVPFDEVERRHPPPDHQMFVPMSFKKMNHARAEKYAEAKAKGYTLISYVSSKATTWPGFTCGENCFIFEDNTIQPFVEIGNNVVLWSGNHIGHHTRIKDHVMITSHVVISGCCTIEPFCFFGVNATVRDETVIARETLVGAGVLILKDTKEFEVYKAVATEPAAFRSDEIRSLSHKSKG